MNDLAVIDIVKCIGCGRCIDICPTSLFILRDGKAVVAGTKCISCAHCEAVCPQEAVHIPSLDNDPVKYGTFQIGPRWIPYGKPDIESLVSLMRSRRSCRHFLDTPVDLAVLEDLAQIGASAPSGTNCQAWTFTILPDRSAVLKLLLEMQQFFKRLNRLARMPLLRFISRLGGGQLDKYHREYCESVEKALSECEESRKDSLFFDAPAVILVGSKPGASTPAEDAWLAAQNILLAAHAMGLGSCLIGFAAAALKRDATIRKRIGIPEEDLVHAVIALGHTDTEFHQITRRKKAVSAIFSHLDDEIECRSVTCLPDVVG